MGFPEAGLSICLSMARDARIEVRQVSTWYLYLKIREGILLMVLVAQTAQRKKTSVCLTEL